MYITSCYNTAYKEEARMAQTPRDLLTEFFKNGEKIVADDGEIVHDSDKEKPDIFYVEDGYIKSYTINTEGDYNILNFYGPDSIFALTPAIRRNIGVRSYRIRSTVYFECVTTATIYKRSVDAFLEFVNNNPGIYQELLYHMMHNYQTYLSSTETRQYRYARHRLIHQLVVLASRFGAEHEYGVTIGLPLTHQDLSDALGMARETITRELEKLRSEGYIVNEHSCITIADVGGLEQELECSR